jgi:hypothetical protein
MFYVTLIFRTSFITMCLIIMHSHRCATFNAPLELLWTSPWAVQYFSYTLWWTSPWAVQYFSYLVVNISLCCAMLILPCGEHLPELCNAYLTLWWTSPWAVQCLSYLVVNISLSCAMLLSNLSIVTWLPPPVVSNFVSSVTSWYQVLVCQSQK